MNENPNQTRATSPQPAPRNGQPQPLQPQSTVYPNGMPNAAPTPMRPLPNTAPAANVPPQNYMPQPIPEFVPPQPVIPPSTPQLTLPSIQLNGATNTAESAAPTAGYAAAKPAQPAVSTDQKIADSQKSTVVTKKTPRKKIILIVIASIVLIAVVVAGVLFAVSRSSQPNGSTPLTTPKASPYVPSS